MDHGLIIIATRSSPQMPSIPGIETVEALANEDVFSISDAPGILGRTVAGVKRSEQGRE